MVPNMRKHTHLRKVAAGSMNSLLSERTPSDVKFGNHCVYLRGLNRYLYQRVVIILIYCSSLFYAVSNFIYKKKGVLL